MEGAAVPPSPSERTCLPVCHSRSRLDFLGASGQGLKGIWLEDSADADTSAESKRFLRTLGGDDATGVPGLGHSPERKASARNSAGVGNPLQSRVASRKLWSRDTRGNQQSAIARRVPEARLPEPFQNQDKRRPWRTPSRILVGESGSLEFRRNFCGPQV